jgi:hypothetical protein
VSKDTADLKALVDEIVPFNVKHGSEPEACDLLMEVDLLPQVSREPHQPCDIPVSSPHHPCVIPHVIPPSHLLRADTECYHLCFEEESADRGDFPALQRVFARLCST